jgi:hypothetical protein
MFSAIFGRSRVLVEPVKLSPSSTQAHAALHSFFSRRRQGDSRAGQARHPDRHAAVAAIASRSGL